MIRYCAIALLLFFALPACSQNSDDKPLDVTSSMGDLHMGKDADAHKAGLPLYPGARPKHDENNDPLNFGILTESFGMKLVVAKYESADSPAKILAFYRDKMKRYGKVLECDDANDNSGFHSDDDKDASTPLKCQGDNRGPVKTLKVGTEGNAHIVSIESADASKGTTFAIVYFHRRGKSGDI
jgi:hypothetical protein